MQRPMGSRAHKLPGLSPTRVHTRTGRLPQQRLQPRLQPWPPVQEPRLEARGHSQRRRQRWLLVRGQAPTQGQLQASPATPRTWCMPRRTRMHSTMLMLAGALCLRHTAIVAAAVAATGAAPTTAPRPPAGALCRLHRRSKRISTLRRRSSGSTNQTSHRQVPAVS